MPAKHKDEQKVNVSPTLFETEQGEPMCFYLRPGPVKHELMPYIKAAGGQLCNVQKPGAILLKDPEEKDSIPPTTSHWYISTKYIHDSIEKNERLNMEDYRLNPGSTQSTKHSSKAGSPGLSGGRTPYTPEEDDAILRYVSKRIDEIGGNKLWQEMGKQQVTSHSWQSMKYRYKVQLAHRLSEYREAEAEQQSEAEDENEESACPQKLPVEMEDPNNSSEAMDPTPPGLLDGENYECADGNKRKSMMTSDGHREKVRDDRTHEAGDRLVCARVLDSSEGAAPQISPSSKPQDEQVDVPQAECNDDEACESMETSKSEIDETPEQLVQPQPDIAASEKENQPEATTEARSSLNSVNRPKTRQQSELENMPYVKRLRSSGTPPEGLLISSKQTSRSKNLSKILPAPPTKDRREIEADVAEEIIEESGQNGTSDKTQTEEVKCPDPPQPTKKKGEKRKLGILEMATKEFEDDSESESDSQYGTPGPGTSIEAVITTSSKPSPTTPPSENQQNPSPIQAEQETPPITISTTADMIATITATAAETTATAVPPSTSTPAVSPIEKVTSKAHLFIFESESQEVEDSPSLIAGPSTSAAGQTNRNKNPQLPSLTQDQLEEDVQLLKAFMKDTSQDLTSVTKAILKASGDLILARELLLNSSSFSEPIWTRTEDQSLCSGDPTVRQELLTKYGEESVAKRLMFLELER